VKIDELIALGGLLHDIGKPVQRANLYTDDHSIQGAMFLKDLARNTGREEYLLLSLFSEFHHGKSMVEENMRKRIAEVHPERFGLSVEDVLNALWIVYEADNLASSEREEGQPQALRPLYSVFTKEKAYPLIELDFKKSLPIPGDISSISPQDYRKLVKGLWKDLLTAKLKVDRILPVLEKYLTFVSSATSEGNVISLYDHMRMTSAIALAMFRSGCTAEDVKSGRCRKEKRFLLIEGDFSGIQDFIYHVSGKGTLKYLRARSAYLELIGWDVVLEILSSLKLTRANVLFNAGGHFLIIAQNTPEVIQELEGIRKHVVEWLYREFDGSLYLALEWEPITGEEFGRKGKENLFSNARGRLKLKLKTRKLQRFGEIEGLFHTAKQTENLKECSICRKEVPSNSLIEENGTEICPTCMGLRSLGGTLPKLKGFILTKGEPRAAMMRGPFRYFVPYMGEEELMEGDEFLLLKNTLEPPEIPENVEFVPYFVADYYKEGKEGVASFDELAENSIGAKRVGILKGDVDNLGDFFKSLDSPSKLATASRFMDYFFKVYLRELILGRGMGEVPSLRKLPEKPDIVVVYAGGDDFFIAGAWDQVFELAFRIRNTFESYTGGKKTLSMGLGYFHPKTPIYRMAEVVNERLETAKDEGKNRVFVVDRTGFKGYLTYTWNHYMELWERYGKIYANGKLSDKFGSKGLLMKILQFREMYVREPKGVRWAYLIAYLFGRHKIDEIDEFSQLMVIDVDAFKANRPQEIYWVDGVLKIILMAVRG